MRMRLGLAFVSLSTLLAATASAQDAAPPAAPPAGTAPPPVVQAPPVAPAAPAAEPGEKDGVRFRGGIGGGGGFFVGGQGPISLSGGLGGIDGRLGVQINHFLGVYANPHLAFGGGSNTSGLGVFAMTGVVDLTLFHRVFLGAGGGGGIFNNPSGGVLQFRAGGYPLQGFGQNGFTRKGLSVAADVRLFFLGGGYSTFVETIFSVGYDVF